MQVINAYVGLLAVDMNFLNPKVLHKEYNVMNCNEEDSMQFSSLLG